MTKDQEARAIGLLTQAHTLIFEAASCLRSDTAATVLIGRLAAARLIVNDARLDIEQRVS